MTHTVGSRFSMSCTYLERPPYAPTKPCTVNAFADCVHPSLHLFQCFNVPSLAARMCPELATPSTLSSTSSSAQQGKASHGAISLLSASNWRMSSRREVRCLTYVHVDLPKPFEITMRSTSASYTNMSPKLAASGALGGDPALGKTNMLLCRTFHGKPVTKHQCNDHTLTTLKGLESNDGHSFF